MTEPSGGLAVTFTSILVIAAGQFSGMDSSALVGAVAGASLFVISAKSLAIPTRIIYFLIAVCMGYLGGPGLLKGYVDEHSISAFIASASVIGVGLRLIKFSEDFNLSELIKAWLNK